MMNRCDIDCINRHLCSLKRPFPIPASGRSARERHIILGVVGHAFHSPRGVRVLSGRRPSKAARSQLARLVILI